MHLTAEFCNSYVVRFKTSYKGSKRNDDCTGQNTVLSIALLLLPFQFSCVFLCMHVAGGLCDAVYFTVFFTCQVLPAVSVVSKIPENGCTHPPNKWTVTL